MGSFAYGNVAFQWSYNKRNKFKILFFLQRKIDKYSELRQQQQVMLNKEEDILEELKTWKKELETTKASNAALQRDKLRLMEELRDVSVKNVGKR